jgi:hypothetical protein
MLRGLADGGAARATRAVRAGDTRLEVKMPAHLSNADRIAKAAAEVAAADAEKAEKAAKKAASPPKKRVSKPREPKPPVRMKIMWQVGEPGSATVGKTFPYADRAAADAEAARLGRHNMVKPIKVPME